MADDAEIQTKTDPNKKQKLFTTFLAILSITLIVVVLSLGILLSSKGSKAEPEKVCTTPTCIKAANLILSILDETVNPCDDFNQFSCGSFIKNRRIPDDGNAIDVFVDLSTNLRYDLSDSLAEVSKNDIESTKNAKNYYASCIDQDDIEANGEKALIDMINTKFNGWQLISSTNKVTEESVFNKIVNFDKMSLRSFFEIFVSEDPKNPTKNILRLQQPSWFSQKKQYLTAEWVSMYRNYVSRFVASLNKFQSTAFSKEEADKMVDLEISLSKYLLDQTEKRNQKYINTTIAKLNADYAGFDWKKYIVTGLYGDHGDLKVNENDIVLVEDPAYLGNFSELYSNMVKDTNKIKTLDNLLTWTFVKSKSNFLPKLYQDIQLEFDKFNLGTNSAAPRSRTCARDILDKMPFAVGRLYVQKRFDESSKKAATQMIDNIRNEFKVMLDELTWMDAPSKKAAKEKADNIDVKIGYPDYTYNNTYMNKLYENYKFSSKGYLVNAVAAEMEASKENLLDIRKERTEKDWLMTPAIVNAYYNPPDNQICFPAGILQAPFYDSKAPNYLNYGAIGSVIGHEITHGFDDQGRKYDKNGVYYEDDEIGLWTDKTIEEYNKKAQCIIDQYNKYIVKQINKPVIGELTQGENIADNGGIKESYRAYKKWEEKNGKEPLLPGLKYNQDQLFFINYAQVWCAKMTDQALDKLVMTNVHAPDEFRIIGPTSNSVEFARAFRCPANKPNNPKDKCAVW